MTICSCSFQLKGVFYVVLVVLQESSRKKLSNVGQSKFTKMKEKLQLQHKVSAGGTHQDHQTASELPEIKEVPVVDEEVPAVDEHVGSAAADIGDAQAVSKKKNQVCIYSHVFVEFLLIWITFFYIELCFFDLYG
jgi:hypothetical protein